MDTDPPLNLGSLHIDSFILLFSTSELVLLLLFLFVLIILSGLISGSEIAYFSFSANDELKISNEESATSKRIVNLKSRPRRLLATILVANNLVNIGIIIVSDYVLRNTIGEEWYRSMAEQSKTIIASDLVSVSFLTSTISFLITVVLVTFVLVLFGEIVPKIYANINNISFAKRMSLLLIVLNKLFIPITGILVSMTENIEGRLDGQKGSSIKQSKEDLGKAIDIATQQNAQSSEQSELLKGILKFGNVSVKQIMKPRTDVVALSIDTKFDELMQIRKEHGYSRIPVYKEDFDELVGILYIKDLLGYSEEDNDFEWQKLIRNNILYIPESKKIDELLKEFQSRHTHIGVVVDEYGGAAGIITLEDIMEEVIGEITDEYDTDNEIQYIKLSENNYIFEGKTLINDFCRTVDEDTEFFSEVQGDSSSLAGLVLEIYGSIPQIEKVIVYKNYQLKVISVSQKRIKKINVIIDNNA